MEKNANNTMLVNKETLKKLCITAGQVIITILLLGIIIYYVINNTEYSTNTRAKETKRLVNKILKNNNDHRECLKVTGFPDKILAMYPEYNLEAQLSDGTCLPVKLKSSSENGVFTYQVEVQKDKNCVEKH